MLRSFLWSILLGGLLFGRVIPSNVSEIVIVRGMGENETTLTDQSAVDTAVLLKTLWATEYTGGDRIRTQTWDFYTNSPLPFTPLVWFIAVRETNHYTVLSCYEVNDPMFFDCWYSYGSADPNMWWHYNALTIEKNHINFILGDF